MRQDGEDGDAVLREQKAFEIQPTRREQQP
jgi:hypothetical protein